MRRRGSTSRCVAQGGRIQLCRRDKNTQSLTPLPRSSLLQVMPTKAARPAKLKVKGGKKAKGGGAGAAPRPDAKVSARRAILPGYPPGRAPWQQTNTAGRCPN
jgi:hypothetical protein